MTAAVFRDASFTAICVVTFACSGITDLTLTVFYKYRVDRHLGEIIPNSDI